MPGPFDEEFTPEEEAALNDATAIPPAEEEGEGNVDDAIREAAQPKPAEATEEPKPATTEEPKPTAEPKPAAQTPEEDAAAEERDLAAFLEKHKGKSPEELARLAFQQSKRANRSEATNRQINARVAEIAERTKRAVEERQRLAAEAPNRKNAFREKLASDPDAATAELHDQLVDSEVAAADEAARLARVDEAIVFADTHIPEFGKQWTSMKSLANEFGYTDAELDAIDDGRALVMLSLANHAARLIKAGIMDRSGNLDLSKIPQTEVQPIDPRLAAPDPQKTLGGGGARSTRSAQTIEQQLNDIAQMTDAELAKFESDNPGAIEDLLRKAAA